jgi:hypothetical protein
MVLQVVLYCTCKILPGTYCMKPHMFENRRVFESRVWICYGTESCMQAILALHQRSAPETYSRVVPHKEVDGKIPYRCNIALPFSMSNAKLACERLGYHDIMDGDSWLSSFTLLKHSNTAQNSPTMTIFFYKSLFTRPHTCSITLGSAA